MIAPEILLGYVESPDPRVRETGLLWIQRYECHEFLGDTLRLLQHDPVAEVREQAAQTLRTLRHPVAIEALVDRLYDLSHAVRVAAGWALVSFGDAIIPAVTAVMCGEERHARIAAYQVLARLDSPAARTAIADYWQDHR